MTFKQLSYFCKVCEYGSVSKAAESLFVTQPTITAAIRSLETEYSIRLFEHKGKVSVLTEEGDIFLENAKVLVQHAENFDRLMSDLGVNRQNVNLGLTRSLGAEIYAEYFRYGVDQHPEIIIVPHTASSSVLLEGLRANRLDVIISPDVEKAISAMPGEDPLAGLNSSVLGMTDMLYCLSEDHPLAGEDEIDPALIVDEPMISTTGDDNKTAALTRLFEEWGLGEGRKPRVIRHCEQLNMALNLIRNGVGCGYFPREGVMHYEGIVTKKIKGDPPIHAHLIWSKPAGRRKPVKKFIDSITKFYNNR